MDLTGELLSKLDTKRSLRLESPFDAESLRAAPYLEAAAVLHHFNPDTLEPTRQAGQKADPRRLLRQKIAPAAGRLNEGLVTLRLEPRREALRRLGSREAMQKALKANPGRPGTPLQSAWESFLSTGLFPDLESLGYHALSDQCQILRWVEGILPDLPDSSELNRLLQRKSALGSFEHLVIDNFTGRKREIDLLREHIGVFPPATRLDAVRRQISAWIMMPARPVLAIHGPGGIGKSALVGRILWEHSQSHETTRLPFAYLAFDQPTLRIESPFTLLVEAAAQFELQQSAPGESLPQFRSAVHSYRDELDHVRTGARKSSSRQRRIADVDLIEQRLFQSFADLLRAVGRRSDLQDTVEAPLLFALDSFEEVHYRDRESLGRFWRMLGIIQDQYPPLRVLISGRAPVSELLDDRSRLREVELRELDVADRITLLERLGVTDLSLATSVASQLGGNPLSLRMAADLVRSDPAAITPNGIEGLTTRTWILFKVDAGVIQGQLYRRILAHIHDDKVRLLAHPGMVLRRVDPGVILHVIAPTCGVDVPDMHEALRLFEELRREHALVKEESDALVYRPDIRSVMLRLLQQDRFEQVRKLHRAAVVYYTDQEGSEARSEELYHRLMLGEDESRTLDNRWIPGIESSLARSLDEYPVRGKVWLASHMNLEVSRQDFTRASIQEWERNVTRKVQQLLSLLDIEGALHLLSERTERSDNSPLFALESKTHMLRNDLDAAWRTLERGVEQVTLSGNGGRLAELWWLQSQIALLQQNPSRAEELLRRAETALQGSSSPIPLIQVLCQRLLIHSENPETLSEAIHGIRYRLDRACECLDDASAYSATEIVSLAARLLEEEFPRTAKHLVQFLGSSALLSMSPNLTSENLQGLDEYRESWELDSDAPLEAMA
jgi:hypothetical protein